MGRNKSIGKKIKIAKATRTVKAAPRWIDLKIFGLARARFRSLKRFSSKKRGGLKV